MYRGCCKFEVERRHSQENYKKLIIFMHEDIYAFYDT
jgi:hypothetical protein